MEPPTVLFFRPLSESCRSGVLTAILMLHINVIEKETLGCCGQHMPLAVWDYRMSTLMDSVNPP